jgi:hypothetical protein
MPTNPYGERARKVLQTAVRTSGVTQGTIERALGMSKGYLSQIFSGRIELKVWHLEVILEAIEFDPQEFFRMVYPRPGEESDATPMEQFAAYTSRHLAARSAALSQAALPPELRAIVQQMVAEELETRSAAPRRPAKTDPPRGRRGAARPAGGSRRKPAAKK